MNFVSAIKLVDTKKIETIWQCINSFNLYGFLCKCVGVSRLIFLNEDKHYIFNILYKKLLDRNNKL